MEQILLFGAGKSATVLIEYLLKEAAENDWRLIVVDQDLALAQSKIGSSEFGTAISFNISDDAQRIEWISQASVVISLLPPTLHSIVAQDCLNESKHLLTASYVDGKI